VVDVPIPVSVGRCRLTPIDTCVVIAGLQPLTLKCDGLLSNFAFNFNLRRNNPVPAPVPVPVAPPPPSPDPSRDENGAALIRNWRVDGSGTGRAWRSLPCSFYSSTLSLTPVESSPRNTSKLLELYSHFIGHLRRATCILSFM